MRYVTCDAPFLKYARAVAARAAPLAQAYVLDFVMTNGSRTVWDNNDSNDFHIRIGGEGEMVRALSISRPF